MKVYISGPISNRSLGEAAEHFCKNEKVFMDAGHTVINPIRMVPYGLTWSTYMKIARAILGSGEINVILMLRGWRESWGARFEWIWANAAGIDVWYEEIDDIKEIRKIAKKGL